MKKGAIVRTVKVGVFATFGILLITLLIFYIGSKQQAFGSKKEITATFKNVSGLKTGNAIRFAGVSIGSIEKIKIISDSSVLVTLAIDSEDSKFIKKDSKVSISTEGLLGSKYLRISSGSYEAEIIENKDHLTSIEPVDFDELLNVLSESGNNFRNITGNVDQLVTKINTGQGVLGAIISDPEMKDKVNQMVTSFGTTGRKTTELTTKMIDAVGPLKTAGENTVKASEDLKEFTKKLNNDSSSLGKILTDTILAKQINTTMMEVETTAEDVKETSSQLRNSWIIKLFGKKNKKDE